MKDEFLYVLYKGLETATVLRKNLDGSQAWTEKDIVKAKKKGLVSGYDMSLPKQWPTIINFDEVQMVYIADEPVGDDDIVPGVDKEMLSEVMYS